jgi:hypothetical protein
MKSIKINKCIIVLVSGLFTLTLGMVACSDFLEEAPKSKLTQEQVFTDPAILEPTVDGLYASFRDAKAGRAGYTFSLLGLDETKQGIVQMMDASQSGLDYYNGSLNPASPQVNEMWTRRWPIVHTAALCIRGLELLSERTNNEETLKKYERLRGDACFVRALVMFELTMYWGEVPVKEITDLNSTSEDLSRQPLNIVWKQIFDDFTYASQKLPDGKQTGPSATKGAALAFLGKLHMYAPAESGYRDFDKAKQYFEQILNSYSLESSYATLFEEYGKCEFNSNESVFEIDYKCNSQGPSYWQWDMGSRTLAGLGESCYIGGYDVALPTEYAHKMKSEGGVWETGDSRKDVSIRYVFTYGGITYTNVSWGADELDPHIKKWEDRRVDGRATPTQAADATSGRSFYWSGKNYLMIRFADILLCYAECLNELNDTPSAVQIINDKVRKRAWRGTLPAEMAWNTGISQEQFRTDVMDERMRELCFEGWRRMDLIRTGKFVELIKDRNPWAKQSGAIRDFHVRYPIPDIELKNNPDLSPDDQNSGYFN